MGPKVIPRICPFKVSNNLSSKAFAGSAVTSARCFLTSLKAGDAIVVASNC